MADPGSADGRPEPLGGGRVLRYVRPAAWPPAPPGWLPHEGWRPDPYWPPVVPGTVLVREDERVGWLWRRSALPAGQLAAVQRDERPPGLEIWVVLAVFPLAAVLTALIVLLQHALGVPVPNGRTASLLGDRPVANALVDLVYTVTDFVPALLVAYLLLRSGGRLAAIGLDRSQPRADLASTGKLFAGAYALPIIVIGFVLASLGADGGDAGADPNRPPPQLVFLLPVLLASLAAGVVEEFVVLGYLSHRLEQRGWTGLPLLAVLVAVRLSYHLYYGWGVLTLVPWAVLSVILYRRRRRLLPFIVAHALWDSMTFLRYYTSAGGFGLVLLVLVGVLLVLFLLGRRRLNRPVLVLGADGVARSAVAR